MRSSAGRALVPAIVVLALLAVVAIAATGSTTAGTDETRRPAYELVLDTVISLGFVALVPAFLIVLYGLMQRKEISREIASGRYPRYGLSSFAAFMAIFTVVTYLRLRDWERPPAEPEEAPLVPGRQPPPKPRGTPGADTLYEPRFAWIPVLVVIGLAAAAALAFFLADRRRKRGHELEPDLAEAVAGAVEDTLDDLRAEADPRRAVIAAYARLERVLAANGLPRMHAETQEEYLARFLRSLEVSEGAATRITELFERAKFSQHAIDVGMKEDAIDALEELRDELRLARETRDVAAPAAVGVGEVSS